MSVSCALISNVGSTAIQSGSGTSLITVGTNANNRPGFLMTLIAYVEGADPRLATDAGDGWRIVDSAYDSVTGYGGLMAMMESRLSGAFTMAGINLPGTANWASQVAIHSIGTNSNTNGAVGTGRFDVSQAGGSFNGGTTETAAGTTVHMPANQPPYPQYFEVAVEMWNNGGSTAITGSGIQNAGSQVGYFFTLNTGGLASPPYAWELGYSAVNPPFVQGNGNYACNSPAFVGVISASVTNRVSLKAMVPVIGGSLNTLGRGRNMTHRRFG